MSDPELYTAAQASDPATDAQTLADIAALRPDLRAQVAANPSTYPGLLEWLGGLGDPTVDAALAARNVPAAPAAPPVQPTQVLPTAPPAPSWATGAPPSQPSTPAPEWQGQPTQAYQAPAPAGPQQSLPPAGQAYPPQGQPPYGQPPYGQQPYAGTPPKKSKAGLIIGIVLGVIALIVIGVIVAISMFVNKVGDAIGEAASSISAGIDDLSSVDPSQSAELDALYASCEAGDYQACDDLFFAAPFGSDYEQFGSTCGGRTDGSQFSCVDEFADGSTDAATDAGTDDSGLANATAYGDDRMMDWLWDNCSSGDYESCDTLYLRAPQGSEYEEYGRTCGERTDTNNYCVVELGGGEAPAEISDTANTLGDDPTLDELWGSCAAGDMVACDDLYFLSPIGSEYETFGDTCGNTTDGGSYCYAY